jgi:cytochrome c556
MQGLFRFLSVAVLGAVGFAVSTPAAAQFAKPEDAIKYRKAVMTLQAAHFGRIAAMANGRIPFDAKVAAENADILAVMVKLPFVAFVEGSDKGDTKAKPEIWTEKDKFAATGAKLQDEVAKLNAAAKAGNMDALKAAVGGVGQTCKGCHDQFRKE